MDCGEGVRTTSTRLVVTEKLQFASIAHEKENGGDT